MIRHNNNLDRAADALKNSRVPAGPPREVIDAAIAKLTESTGPTDTGEKRIGIIERIWASRLVTKIAVAAVIVIAVWLVVGVFPGSGARPKEDVVVKEEVAVSEKVVQVPEDSIVEDTREAEKPGGQLLDIRDLFVAGDVDGLVAVLSDGEFESQLVAALFLSQIGDERAIAPLEKLSAEYGAEMEDNLFATVAAKIKKRLASEKEDVATEIDEVEEETETEIEANEPMQEPRQDLEDGRGD